MNIDIIVLLALFALFAFATYQYGKSYFTAFILAFYPAYFLFDIVKTKVSSKEPMVIIGLFVVSFGLVLYILRKTISAGYSYSQAKHWVDSIILSLGAISQIAFVYYHTLPQLSSVYNLSGQVDQIFNTTVPYIVLALIPFIALLITARD